MPFQAQGIQGRRLTGEVASFEEVVSEWLSSLHFFALAGDTCHVQRRQRVTTQHQRTFCNNREGAYVPYMLMWKMSNNTVLQYPVHKIQARKARYYSIIFNICIYNYIYRCIIWILGDRGASTGSIENHQTSSIFWRNKLTFRAKRRHLLGTASDRTSRVCQRPRLGPSFICTEHHRASQSIHWFIDSSIHWFIPSLSLSICLLVGLSTIQLLLLLEL